jgi:histidinol-phosphate phosphatase family protein
MKSRPTIFLDKDGTLVENVPYNIDPQLIQPARGAVAGLSLLARAGYQLVVVSNQSGVARGYFEEAALVAVEQQIRGIVEAAGAGLAGFYYCPHYPSGSVARYAMECDCRKPKPGLLLRAAGELDAAIDESWMVGDILDDVEAGHLAGCRAALIVNGGETLWQLTAVRKPEVVATDLFDAARKILSYSEPPVRTPFTSTYTRATL